MNGPKRSSFCSNSNGCVKAHIYPDGSVNVFDEQGNVCSFDKQEWPDFIAGVKNGEFDLEQSN